MTLVLVDDAAARSFEPFALTRPGGELRAGAILVRERWEWAVGERASGSISSGHLADFGESLAPPVLTGGLLRAGTLVANSRVAPALARAEADLDGADLVLCDGRTAAVRLARDAAPGELAAWPESVEELAGGAPRRTTVRGWWMDHVWDFVRHLPGMLAADIPAIASVARTRHEVPGERIGPHELFVEEGAEVEPHVVFDLRSGPVLVRRQASVSAFSRLAGPCVIGEGSLVLGDRVAGSSIGDNCRVRGEVSSSIFTGHANKSHDGFVGHSILGRWVNLGASTVTSNLKNTYGPVRAWTPGGWQDTGLQFLGTLLGDHAKTAIGTRLSTGSVVGAGANVLVDGLTPKVIAPFAWGGAEGADSSWDPDRFVEVAARVMQRRGVHLDDRGRRHLLSAFRARRPA